MTTASAAQAASKRKSPEAFRTISEVSLELDVPQHVLRFWEARFSQVRPVKRAGGRRFYRPEDVALLRGIRSFLYSEGYTIKGVQKVLREKGWRHVAELGRNLSGLPAWNEWRSNDEAATDESDVSANALGARSNSAMAALLRAHADAAETMTMKENKRVRLELLLAELLTLRDRLKTVMPKH